MFYIGKIEQASDEKDVPEEATGDNSAIVHWNAMLAWEDWEPFLDLLDEPEREAFANQAPSIFLSTFFIRDTIFYGFVFLSYIMFSDKCSMVCRVLL